MDERHFLKKYSQALRARYAGVFAGAGVSVAAGYVDWQELLSDVADELKLDVGKHEDLIALAQYYVNRKAGNRQPLTQLLVTEFLKDAAPTETQQLLARLPLDCVWTTNYDQLLEAAFRDAGKVPDTKIRSEDLSHTRRGRDLVLYKMHGCISQPHETVLTKDDYERYQQNRSLFADSLRGDLIQRTFLFLGFSFRDPNIDYILSRVRVALPKEAREHYCIMRRPKKPHPFKGQRRADYEYTARLTELRHEDLRRFGIETVWVDDYTDVPPLLRALAKNVSGRTVFVSGAAAEAVPMALPRLMGLTRQIGNRLVRNGFSLVSGFGIGIGQETVLGALEALYGLPRGDDVDRLVVRPFPGVATSAERTRAYTAHREDLVGRSGSVIVIAGNRRRTDGAIEESPGVREEAAIALRDGKAVIPIGATGYAARRLWEAAVADPQRFLGYSDGEVTGALQTLGAQSPSDEQIMNALFLILGRQSERNT